MSTTHTCRSLSCPAARARHLASRRRRSPPADESAFPETPTRNRRRCRLLPSSPHRIAPQSSTHLSAVPQYHGINAGGELVGTKLSPPGSRGSARPPGSRGSARSPLHAPKRSPSPPKTVASKVSDAKVAFVELDPAIISKVCWPGAGAVSADVPHNFAGKKGQKVDGHRKAENG